MDSRCISISWLAPNHCSITTDFLRGVIHVRKDVLRISLGCSLFIFLFTLIPGRAGAA